MHRLPQKFSILYFLLLTILSLPICVQADVVKPALIEISAYTHGKVEIEIRTSIEALLTGINSQYKNTQQAPTAKEYDLLRVLDGDALREKFTPFEERFLSSVGLHVDSKEVVLSIESVDIPEAGYTKVPRTSIIVLTGQVSETSKELRWYYPERFGDNAVRVRQVDVANEKWHWSSWQWLKNDKQSELFSLQELFKKAPLTQVVGDYIIYGFEHIIPKGLDHILFILGIFLLSTKLKPLLWQITMFTVAHTMTLGLSMNGYIDLPPRIVEPLIALSIAYIGIENIFAHRLHKSRLFLVFAFGLLHGLGFAGVLSEFGMPKDGFAIALISFNVGVELGQLVIVLLAWFGVAYWFRSSDQYRKFVVIPASLMISTMGLYWMLERLQLI